VVRPFFSRSLFQARSPGRAGRMRSPHSTPDRRPLVDLEAALAGILDCFRSGAALSSPACSAPKDRSHLVRGNQGRSPAPFEPRSARSGAAADRGERRRASRGQPAPTSTSLHWPPCAPPARRWSRAAAINCPLHLGTTGYPGTEIANGEAFDGKTEVATFSGRSACRARTTLCGRQRISRAFAVPAPKRPIFSLPSISARRLLDGDEPDGTMLPHIRLDRAPPVPESETDCNERALSPSQTRDLQAR